jgi:DNA mismatch repair protein MutH
MERSEAIPLLQALEGIDLHEMAIRYNVPVVKPDGKVNKGWAGHVCERHLGLPLNSSQSPNFGSWELKSVPIKELRDGTWTYKETMAVTMIDPVHVIANPFETSHLLTKLRKFVLVVRKVGSDVHKPSYVYKVTGIDLEGSLLEQVKEDYELVRNTLMDSSQGFTSLTGTMGVYIQPRTKGAGHGSTSRAFYARTGFLEKIVPIRGVNNGH